MNGNMASRLPVDLFSTELPDRSVRETICTDLETLIKSTYPNIQASLDAIETHGLPVFEVACQFHLRALMLLSNVDYGFISPEVPHYTDLVETLKKYFPDKEHVNYSQGLILLNAKGDIVLHMLMAIYHWKAYINGLPGYSEAACRLSRMVEKRYKGMLPPKFLESLTIEELTDLRARMKRDEEAIIFLRHIMNRVLIPKNNAKHFVEGKAQA